MSVWHRVKKVSSERHTQPRTGSASTTTMKHRLLCVARWTGGVYCARITLHGPDPPTPNLTSQHQAAPLAPADFVHAILREEPRTWRMAVSARPPILDVTHRASARQGGGAARRARRAHSARGSERTLDGLARCRQLLHRRSLHSRRRPVAGCPVWRCRRSWSQK